MALSKAKLNRLVQLHRRGVQGADTQLRELIETCPKTLAEGLGISVEAIHANPEPDAVVALAMTTAADRREERDLEALEEANILAQRIAQEAHYGQGEVHLDPFLMTRLVVDTRIQGNLVIIRDEVFLGAVPLSVLRAVMRSCARCRVDALYLDATHLVLRYRTASARGGFRFVLTARDPWRPAVELRLQRSMGLFDRFAQEVGR